MSFQNRLKEFFTKYDPDRLYLASKIARTFRGDEDVVFNRLEEIYKNGGPSKLTYKELAPKPSTKKREVHDEILDPSDSSVENSQPVKKKGKAKKFILIILILAALGGGGFYGYTTFIAGNDADSDETHASDDGDHGEGAHASDEGVNGDGAHESNSADNHGDTHEASSDIHDSDDAHESTDTTTHAEHIENTDSTIQDLKDAADALHVLGM